MKVYFYVLLSLIVFSIHITPEELKARVYCSDYQNCLDYAKKCLDDVESTQSLAASKKKTFNAIDLDAAQQFIQKAEELIGNSEETIIIVNHIRYYFLNDAFDDRHNKIITLFNKLQRNLAAPDYVEANYYAGRSYYEISQFEKARSLLKFYIKTRINNDRIQEKKEALKLFLSYYYFKDAYAKPGIPTDIQYDQLTQTFDEWINNNEVRLDLAKMIKRYKQWKEVKISIIDSFDLSLKYFYKNHSNVHLLPDDLPFTISAVDEIYNDKTDHENAVLVSAKYATKMDRIQPGLNGGLKGVYFENFYADNKDYDFRGSSANAFLNLPLFNDFDLDTDYTFSRSCQDSQKYQQENRIDFKATWKIPPLYLIPESHISFLLSRNYIDNFQIDKLDGIQTDIGSLIYINPGFCQLQLKYQNENRSVDVDTLSDQSFSGFKLNLMAIIQLPFKFYIIEKPQLYGYLSYRKRIFDQHDHFFEAYREEKKKMIKAGLEWQWSFIDSVSSSFGVKHTKNDASIQAFEYENTEWILSLEWKPF